MNNVLIHPHERVDDLHRKGYKIIQNPENFCFGVDAVLLSGFVSVKKNEICLDLGTGTGIIPILLECKTNGAHFTGVEIQKDCVEMANRSVELNGISNKVSIIEADIKNLPFPLASFDVVTSNPPYIENNHGLLSSSDKKAIARHEILCTLEDVVCAAAKQLRPAGRFYMIHKPHRLCEIVSVLKANRLEPKTMRFIHPRIYKEPTMVMIESVRGGKPFLKVLPPLVIYKNDLEYTDEIVDIYYG